MQTFTCPHDAAQMLARVILPERGGVKLSRRVHPTDGYARNRLSPRTPEPSILRFA